MDKTEIYELGYLLLPSIPEEEVGAVEGNLKAAIAAIGATEVASEPPFKIDLAYTMTKTVGASRYVVKEAFLGWVKFEASPEKIVGLKVQVDQMPEVLRSLLIKAPLATDFTFAKARAALAEAAEPAPEAEKAPVVE